MTVRRALPLALLLGVLAAVTWPDGKQTAARPVTVATPPPERVGASIGQRTSCYGGTSPYIPSALAWGDTSCLVIVSSAFSWNAGLVPGQYPDSDSDYIHPYGRQQALKLPGPAQAEYRLAYVFNVVGSGCVETWRTPTGGLFAMLHLACGVYRASYQYVTATLHLPARATPGGQEPLNNEQLDQLTTDAIAQYLATAPPRATPGTVAGGTVVALSQWPTNPAYGAGVAGPANSHFCLVSTPLATKWFADLAYGRIHFTTPKPTPPRFNHARWHSYRKAHKQGLISPKRNGKLTLPAKSWQWHQYLGGIVAKGRRYTPKRGVPYRIIPYARGRQVCWDRYQRCKTEAKSALVGTQRGRGTGRG
jgi:hypothetical protein